GSCELPEGVEMVMPGDNIKMVVTLIKPIAMEDGLRFAIREGGRTVGAGVVAKIIEYSTFRLKEKGPSGPFSFELVKSRHPQGASVQLRLPRAGVVRLWGLAAWNLRSKCKTNKSVF